MLTTPRLALRCLDESDLDSLAAMYSDAETMRFIGTGQTLDRGEFSRLHTA
jgi:RimJ/RimL family protein N-acetyltransferase